MCRRVLRKCLNSLHLFFYNYLCIWYSDKETPLEFFDLLGHKYIYQDNLSLTICDRDAIDGFTHHDDDELLLVDVVHGDRVVVDHDFAGVDQLLSVDLYQ